MRTEICYYLLIVSIGGIIKCDYWRKSVGDMFQDPQWIPETLDSTETSIFYVFSCTFYVCDKI